METRRKIKEVRTIRATDVGGKVINQLFRQIKTGFTPLTDCNRPDCSDLETVVIESDFVNFLRLSSNNQETIQDKQYHVYFFYFLANIYYWKIL